jgi:lipoprotein NlpI
MQRFLDRLFRRPGTAAAALQPAAAPESATATAVIHYRRGNAQRSEGRLGEALASYDAAVALDEAYAHAWCNRGVVLRALGRRDAALASYERALALDPQDAMAHYNRALVLQDSLRWEEALAGYDAALGLDPQFADAQYNRALAQLYCGDYANGWRGFEWRWSNAQRLSIGERRVYPQPLWLGGEPLARRRILLYEEGGLGDTLQFCRYVPLLAAQGATVLLSVQAPLVSLLARLAGVTAVFASGSVPPPFDCHCPLMSLPLACGTTLATVPARVPYLRPDAGLVAACEARLGPRTAPRVGITWSGNPDNWIDGVRSLRLADWLPWLPPEFRYYRLQKDVRPTDRAALEATPLITSLDDVAAGFDRTAALACCMDAVVSTDTSILHLAGALGLPTLALLSQTPDWRWLRDRSDSPWYPTLTLVRQERAGDWLPVFQHVAAELRRRLGGAAASPLLPPQGG